MNSLSFTVLMFKDFCVYLSSTLYHNVEYNEILFNFLHHTFVMCLREKERESE